MGGTPTTHPLMAQPPPPLFTALAHCARRRWDAACDQWYKLPNDSIEAIRLRARMEREWDTLWTLSGGNPEDPPTPFTIHPGPNPVAEGDAPITFEAADGYEDTAHTEAEARELHAAYQRRKVPYRIIWAPILCQIFGFTPQTRWSPAETWCEAEWLDTTPRSWIPSR